MSTRQTVYALRAAAYAVLIVTLLVAIAYGSWWLAAGVGLTLLACAIFAVASWLELEERQRYAERLRRLG